MQGRVVRLVHFSPTGTTEKILGAIAEGISEASTFAVKQVKSVPLAVPSMREQALECGKDELVLIGVPVYMGRVPALLEQWFSRFRANGALVVCVAVYGNRTYDNALLELCDLVEVAGGIPVAGGAFIGEHSFSSEELPTAQGRPDADDLNVARRFGALIREKLTAAETQEMLTPVAVKGERPYGGVTTLWDVDFISVDDTCIQCGVCAEVCPAAAIAKDNSRTIDVVACITCCACIKECPQGSRSIASGPVLDAAHRLSSLYSERKEPELFV